MFFLKRTNSTDEDFINLVSELDAELAIRDGDDHGFYDQFNKIQSIHHVLVIYVDDKPAGCGAIKKFDQERMEVKRMYVVPDQRGKGLAAEILAELEKWATELGYSRCILETGKKQPEAIRLYEKSGYSRMENYGQYQGVENSLCFEKVLPDT